jgi:hypothetical protein
MFCQAELVESSLPGMFGSEMTASVFAILEAVDALDVIVTDGTAAGTAASRLFIHRGAE